MRSEILDEIGDQLIAMTGDTPEQVAEVLSELAQQIAEKTGQPVEEVLSAVAKILDIDTLKTKAERQKKNIRLSDQLTSEFLNEDLLNPESIPAPIVELILGEDFGVKLKDQVFGRIGQNNFQSQLIGDNITNAVIAAAAELSRFTGVRNFQLKTDEPGDVLSELKNYSNPEGDERTSYQLTQRAKLDEAPREKVAAFDEAFKTLDDAYKEAEKQLKDINWRLLLMSIQVSGFGEDLKGFATHIGAKYQTVQIKLKEIKDSTEPARFGGTMGIGTPRPATIEQWLTPLRNHLIELKATGSEEF